jgi:hypothetical protein
MTDPDRQYSSDGWRRIRPSERSPGMSELKLPDGRCVQAVGVGPAVEAAIMKRARKHG